MGIRQAASLHADPEGKNRRCFAGRANAAGSRGPCRQSGRGVFLGSFSAAAPAAARALVGEALRAAGRRSRQVRRRVRSVSAGDSQRLPDLRAGNRHAQGQPHPAGHPHQQQQPRDVRRAQAPLFASVHRFSGFAAGNGDHQTQGSRRRRAARRRSRAFAALAAQARFEKDSKHQRDPRLGARAHLAQRQGARSRAGRRDAFDRDEVRSRHSQGAPGAQSVPGREAGAGSRRRRKRPPALGVPVMEERLIEFAGVLRRNGIRVSLSENMDTFRALELVGITDPLLFRHTLRTTLVKRAGDVKPFEELFDYFFFGIGQALDAIDRRIMEELGLSPEQFQEMLEQIQRLLKEMEGDLSALTRALLNNNRAELERQLREAMQQEMEQGTPDSFRLTPYTRMSARLQLDRVQSELERFRGMLQMLSENGEDLQNVMRYLDERMRDLNRLLREIIQQEQRKKGLEPRDSSQRSALGDKSFAFYTEDDIRRMNDAVARLAQRLKNRLSVRRKKAARGRFNVKDTLRKNLQYGGVPFHIQLDRRKKTKPQVMVLCDISA